MFKRILITILFFSSLVSQSQDFSALWEGHFSYYNIKDVKVSGDKIFAASENAIFTLDVVTNEISTLSTIEGLAGASISTIHYSADFGALIVGYENGLIEIVLDGESNVLSVVDILEKPTIPPTSKRVNQFNESDGLLYIATNYGISVYDLSRLEFGDTYYIGPSGTQIVVSETAVANGYIYAACQNGSGIMRAEVANSNLIDYNQWSQITTGNFSAITEVASNLYALNTTRTLFRVTDSSISSVYQYAEMPEDVESANDYLIVTTSKNVFLYTGTFSKVAEVGVNTLFSTNYTSAVTDGTNFYIGTNSLGLLKSPISSPTAFEAIRPDGPLMNAGFSVEAEYNQVWLTFGDYTATYNPSPLRLRGVSHYSNGEWRNIPSDSVLGARDLNAIAINPNKINQVFISSFNDGILEVDRDEATMLYNASNSALESLEDPNAPNYTSIRVSASAFDNEGLLWSLTGRNLSPLKSYNPDNGQWRSYSFGGLFSDGFNGEWGFCDLEIDNAGVVWTGGYVNGLMGYDYNNGSPRIKSLSEDTQNMPSSVVSAVAVDNRNQVWIGTIRGLRVLYNTANFFANDNIQASEIVILDDGIPKELLALQYITDIEVDGSNNKWISTVGSGLFYFSPDGQETIYHFTTENSPLPSNDIVDVSIDSSNGKVFIATNNGMVAFNSGSSKATEDFTDAFVYPNPVRPHFNITEEKVKIKGITDNVNIKITDVEGNLVAEAQSNVNLRYNGYNLEIDGGIAYWNGKNLANNVVRSGVYLIMLSDLDTFETKVLKVMVVR
ncbi:ABC transporter substrate-binding protein [Formosa sp. A9]|uniref:type IX secretion system anionic LPS delivery protein PorZ n=1 Tax=Formosa sp. A9 TaxID=3442641 RepID=UPI003EBADEFB